PLTRAIGEVSNAIVDVMAEGRKMGMSKSKKHHKKEEKKTEVQAEGEIKI
ncbi:MAG: sporulation protein, partial [Methanobacteriales archaeon HGW-Methanobacteriales-2]